MGGIGPGQRLKQEVTYWAPSTRRNDYNEAVFENPVLLKGFWYDGFMQVQGADGQTIESTAMVHVSADVSVNGWLALGNFTYPTNVGDPASLIAQDNVKAAKIQDFKKTTDLRNMDYDRVAVL